MSSELELFIEDDDNDNYDDSKDDEILIIAKEKIIKAVLNPKKSMTDLGKMSYRQFAEYADIKGVKEKYYNIKTFTLVALEIREFLDSILYGNIDPVTITINDVFDRIPYSYQTILMKYERYFRAYIAITLMKRLKIQSTVSPEAIQISEHQLQEESPQETLATTENQPEILTITKFDANHFYVVGKNLPSYRSQLLSMGGLLPRKRVGKKMVSRHDVVKFANTRKKEIKRFIFTTLNDKLKADRTLFGYAKRKFKIYLDGALLYLDYHKMKPFINYRTIIIVIRNLYRCYIPVDNLKEEEKPTVRLIEKILTKLSSKKYIRNYEKYEIDQNAMNLLTSIVFYQTDRISAELQPDDYQKLRLRIEKINQKILSKKCHDWIMCSTESLLKSAQSFDPESTIGSRLIDFSLSFVNTLKHRKNALDYTKQVREEFRNEKDLSQFLASQGILWNTKILEENSLFSDKESLITMIAAIHFLIARIKNSERIRLRIKALS